MNKKHELCQEMKFNSIGKQQIANEMKFPTLMTKYAQ